VKERKVPRAVPKAARAPRMVARVETKARATPRAVVKTIWTIWAPRIKARAIVKEMKVPRGRWFRNETRRDETRRDEKNDGTIKWFRN
jgi:hypothetical protein